MAMDLGGANGGVKSDINVTPLVDVMLVLLIIMMLIAPLLQQGVAVTLPEAANTGDKPDTRHPFEFAPARDRLAAALGAADGARPGVRRHGLTSPLGTHTRCARLGLDLEGPDLVELLRVGASRRDARGSPELYSGAGGCP